MVIVVRPDMALLMSLIIALGPTAVTAQGQTPPASDPDADSPSGTIYQIPLDTARDDAKPDKPSSKTPTDSPIHSENGFGSSSTVPGADASDANTPQQDQAPPNSAPPADSPSKDSDGVPKKTSGVSPTLGDDSSSTPVAAIVLLAVVAIVGAGIGISSARRRRAR